MLRAQKKIRLNKTLQISTPSLPAREEFRRVETRRKGKTTMDTGTTAGDEVLEVGARVGRLGERSSLVRRPSGRRGKRKGLRLISHGAIEQGR
jgi:hypothetical protein